MSPPLPAARLRDHQPPDRVIGAGSLVPNAGFDQYFNPAAFRIPGTVPNVRGVPIADLRQLIGAPWFSAGPARPTWIFLIFKDFHFGEKRRVEFGAEVLQPVNTPDLICRARPAPR